MTYGGVPKHRLALNLVILVLVSLTTIVFSDVSALLDTKEKANSVVDFAIVPGSENKIIQVWVTVDPSSSEPSGPESKAKAQEIFKDCKDPACLAEKSQKILASDTLESGKQFSLKNAHFSVSYFNPAGSTFTYQWTVLPSCQNVIADQVGKQKKTLPDGTIGETEYYYGTCNLAESGLLAGSSKIFFKITYLPQADEAIKQSSTDYTYEDPLAKITPTSQFTTSIKQVIDGVQTSVSGTDFGVGKVPCLGLFLILGLLFASMYFAGRSPISLLDIASPRLPTPKGVAASGQILGPFGYTEMKGTVKQKQAAAIGAIDSTLQNLKSRSSMAGGLGGDRELAALEKKIESQKVPFADSMAKDAEQGKKVASALVAGGRLLGMSSADLASLTQKLPYYYGDAEHKLAANIMERLEKQGGRRALLGMTIKDYIFGMRTFQSLETLTAHPAVGQRSGWYHALTTQGIGRLFGANRYAILGGLVMAGTDSTFRTGRMVARGTAAATRLAPELARRNLRSTMELIGGRRLAEKFEPKQKAPVPVPSGLASAQKKHPSEVVVGQMFPVNDKLAHLYGTLRDETTHDQMRYLLKQLYSKSGVRFDIAEDELAKLGYTNVDILRRSIHLPDDPREADREVARVFSSVQHIDAEVKRILSDHNLTAKEKLDQLKSFAVSQGVHIDHNFDLVTSRMDQIDHSAQPEYMKFVSLKELLENQQQLRTAAHASGGVAYDDSYVCHVGGTSLKGHEIWETMVLRTMIWDGVNGHLNGGIREELLSARLNVVDRLVSLNPSSPASMAQLPEYMRNPAELRALAERNRRDLISLFTAEGRRMFEQYIVKCKDEHGNNKQKKNIRDATIGELVDFMQGGLGPRTSKEDFGKGDKVGRGKIPYTSDSMELTIPAKATHVDVKRNWQVDLNPQMNLCLGQWVESRFTRGYVPAFKASIEAELNRHPDSANWTVEQRTAVAKKLWVADQLMQDMEQRFNSQFSNNAYGTLRETSRFYGGVAVGFLTKLLEEKKVPPNDPNLAFLRAINLDDHSHLVRLRELMEAHQADYEAMTTRNVTYDDIAKSQRPIVMLHEGGYAYYSKGLMLSDKDRIMSGETALRDNKGQLRRFFPPDVIESFHGNTALERTYEKLRAEGTKQQADWHPFLDAVKSWARTGAYDYEKEKTYAAVLWNYANSTYDYSRFWHDSAVTVEAKRSIPPTSIPLFTRFFGVEMSPAATDRWLRPIRDIGNHFGDYLSKVSLLAGGPVHKSSYDITAVSAAYRMHSFELSNRIMSGDLPADMNPAERDAYRAVAINHGAFFQVWRFAVDRNPWRNSTSFGAHQNWSSYFHFGPAANYDVWVNLRSYMDRPTYANFMMFYGFPMDLAGRLIRPYVGMVRGMQMSMQGYASKWDSTEDQLRQWNYTNPRIREAMQSMNPFSFRWFQDSEKYYGVPLGPLSRLAKLNKFGGSLERHQLAGPEFQKGLGVGPSDVFLKKKGIFSDARIGDANPSESSYDYRGTAKMEAPLAEYLFRSRDAAMMYDRNVQEAAMNTTARRTVAAEALCMRRMEEIRMFGLFENPLAGWLNPFSFVYHMPIPLFPQHLTPKEMLHRAVVKFKSAKAGGPKPDRSVAAKINRFKAWTAHTGQNVANNAREFTKPAFLHNIVYCPRCGTANYRGTVCKRAGCGQVQY